MTSCANKPVSGVIMPKTGSLSLALAQINSTVGDLSGNYKRIIRARDEAAQKDEDSLPPYSHLDAILAQLVENEAPVSKAANGQPEDVVRRVQHLLYMAEYKRRQAPPGVKVTRRSFGRDRRYPVTNRFRD